MGTGLIALLLATTCSPASADSYCGNGRHVGAENDGAGMSWRCVPDTTRNYSSGGYGGGGGGGGSAAAGLGAAAAGLEGLAALLTIASALGSMISTNHAPAPVVPNYDAEQAAARSRDWNQQAIEAMRIGRFDQAVHYFQWAADQAHIAGNFDDAAANLKNAKIANAQFMLSQGYRHQKNGELAEASSYYMRGKQAAEAAGASDLARKLAEFNDQLMARAGGAKDGVNDTRTSCATINGRFICR